MDVLVDVLRAHGRGNTAMAWAACSTIGDVTAGSTDNQEKYGAVPGSMEVLADILKRHRNAYGYVGSSCVNAVRYATVGNADNHAKYAAVPGSMEVLIEVLRAHRSVFESLTILVDVLYFHGRSNVAVARAACSAIDWIAARSADNQAKYGAIPGSMYVLVSVLQKHGSANAEVASSCVSAIGYVTAGNADNQVKYAAVPKSMDVLVDVLRAHGKKRASISALEKCCETIKTICESNAANKAKLNSLNCVDVLRNEVTVLPSDNRYKRGALSALGQTSWWG
jgi:hypothetical protein